MIGYLLVTVAIMVEVAAAPSAVCPYPNELPGFQFCHEATWRTLQPLVSTSDDIRRVLGEPKGASDIAHYLDPYPGDQRAKAPVLTFDGGRDWDILVYLVRSDYSARQSLSKAVQDRLLSIDLVPKHPKPFGKVSIPSKFRKKHVIAADAAWDEYADGSGLVYEVYTSRTPYGDEKPGDLNRISYGPSDEQRIQGRR